MKAKASGWRARSREYDAKWAVVEAAQRSTDVFLVEGGDVPGCETKFLWEQAIGLGRAVAACYRVSSER